MIRLQATFTFFPKCKHHMRLDYNFLTSPLKGLCHERGGALFYQPGETSSCVHSYYFIDRPTPQGTQGLACL